MSVKITIDHAVKKYGDNVVIPDLSLEIEPGEFFTLLGPSGCGKTTLLRMIAGFNSIEGGDFYFNEERINTKEASKREIGMVFQNYAIFPHMSVRKNVEYGLKNRRIPRAEARPRVDKFLALMQIDNLAERMPDRLSGGQQQRIALARALVIEPKVLLMDEPLSNLDAKLRVEMRSVIKHIQQEVGITTVYVTHDQEEAMAVSDRIAVMNHGVIQQVGEPHMLYHRPANTFVANFIGRTNILNAVLRVTPDGNAIMHLEGERFPLASIHQDNLAQQDIVACIRPEEFHVHVSEPQAPYLQARVEESIFLGLNTNYTLQLQSGTQVEVTAESSVDSVLPTGAQVYLTVNTEKINVFSQDGEHNLRFAAHTPSKSGDEEQA